MPLFVGIDVSSKNLEACLMDGMGETLATQTVTNNRAFYQKKYREVHKHSHKRALVLTARKLVRLIDALLRNDQIYAPKKKVTR